MTPDDATHYRIVAAAAEHCDRLLPIELASASIFPDEDVPPRLKVFGIPASMHRRAAEEGRLWVALAAPAAPALRAESRGGSGETPVGFAHVTMVDDNPYVFEVDVHPAHARRGVGTRLMRAVESWAREKGFGAVTLTTFSHLPWNAPFYARLGFREIPEADLTPGLRAQLAREAANGLDPAKRVAMRLPLVGG
ncbi:MAG TPA: GNAT family N-acetyltransferase [Candidatus Eisenbacteria bacterium]|nr:GNAT family N-acetyltransferase [Candidatus Eisenbacteria bacterium]